MIIKRTLSELKQQHQISGYVAPDTEELQYQSFFSTKDIPCKTTLTQPPGEVYIRMRWRAKRPKTNNTATLQVGQQAYAPAYLYLPDLIYASSIEYLYKGYGRYIADNKSTLLDLDLEIGAMVHQFDFQTYQHDVYEHRTPQADNKWMVIPRDCLEHSGVNHILYRAYGGAYKNGQPLSALEQAYFTILSDGAKTKINLKKHSDLIDINLQPPHRYSTSGQTSIFVDPEPPRTPVNDIINGGMRLPVTINGQTYQYKSIDYRSVDTLSNIIEVTFVPIGG